MTSKRMSAGDDDAPALAGAIVYHAGEVCESADHLWRVLGDVSIPVDGLTDDRQQHKVANGTEPMARVYLYQHIRPGGRPIAPRGRVIAVPPRARLRQAAGLAD